MSHRNALRKLTRKFPTESEIEHIIKGLAQESDLSAIVIGTALVEGLLEALLIHKFHTQSSMLNEQLFTNRGPLSDFNGKILISLAIGIIDQDFADELHSLRAIRNAFSHSKVPLSFDNAVIKKELSAIKLANVLRKKELETPAIAKMNNRDHFLMGVRFMLGLIMCSGYVKGPFSEARQTFATVVLAEMKKKETPSS